MVRIMCESSYPSKDENGKPITKSTIGELVKKKDGFGFTQLINFAKRVSDPNKIIIDEEKEEILRHYEGGMTHRYFLEVKSV